MYPRRENLIRTRRLDPRRWTYRDAFDISRPGFVIIQRPSPDISQYVPSFSRYCMEMLGRREVSPSRVPRAFARSICSRLQRTVEQKSKYDCHYGTTSSLPLFNRRLVPPDGSTSMSAVRRARLKAAGFAILSQLARSAASYRSGFGRDPRETFDAEVGRSSICIDIDRINNNSITPDKYRSNASS